YRSAGPARPCLPQGGFALDMDDLRIFIETARHGNFSKAARAMSLSQPAVSRRIRRMEDELAVQLLDRSGSVVSPTRHGLEFLRFAEKVLKNFDALQPKLVQEET